MRQFLPSIVFSLAAATVALAGQTAAPARGEMAVAFAPFTSESTASAVVRAAGGYLVAPTRFSNVVVAFAPDHGFQSRARALGALFFVDATGLCAPLKETNS